MGGARPPPGRRRAPVETGSIAGRVVDANTGAPVPDVVVMVQETGHSTQTDEQGAFELSGVPAGRHDLFVSTIGYSLARPAVDVSRGATTTLTIPLAEGTGAYTDRVTVTADTRACRRPGDSGAPGARQRRDAARRHGAH